MTVIVPTEIELNGVKYPVAGLIEQFLASVLPQKTVIGDYTHDSDAEVSSWVVSDLSGGLLVDKIVQQGDESRAWWYDLTGEYPSHMRLPQAVTTLTLPTLPTITDPGLEAWNSASDLTNWVESFGGTGGSVARESTTKYAGSYSARLMGGDGALSGSASITQALSSPTNFIGTRIVVKAYVNTSVADVAYIFVTTNGTGGTTTYSSAHTGAPGWEQLTVTRVVPSDATTISVGALSQSITSVAAYFDTFSISTVSIGTGTVGLCNFNSNLYAWVGTSVLKLNSGGTGFDFVGDLNTNITDMCSSLNSRLYIAVGDSTNYWWMSTANAFTQSNSAAYWFKQWNGSLYKFLTTGAASFSADPDAGGPTWTADGTISDIPATKLRKPEIYQDANGNDVLYWINSIILKVHDSTNDKWLDTKVKLTDHANGGKGSVAWNDSLFISQGLQVKKYTMNIPAIVDDVGLDRRDGIPSEYNGEIVKMTDAEDGVIALVDSSQTTGDSYSTLWQYNDAWYCLWADTSYNNAMHDVLISTAASAYRLYWAYGSTPTFAYRTLQRGLKNPSQLSGSLSYRTSGFLVTPWFDGGWSLGAKVAVRVKVKVNSASATETVVVKYRINRATTALGSTWTTLGTITGTGEESYAFATGVGVEFRDIQFRLDLASGSATASPDVASVTLSYYKRPTTSWGWRVPIDCSSPYQGKASAQLVSALETAATTTTLVSFVINNTVNYVRVKELAARIETGEIQEGQYILTLVAV